MSVKDKKEGKVQFFRILQIDKELRTGSYPSSEQLAKKFEVSKRTVERDIEFLRDRYGAPIEYDYSKRGFTYTQPAFFLKSLFLTEEEFFSVAVFEKVLRQYRNTPLEDRLKGIFTKLVELMPEDSVSMDTLWVDDSVSFIADPAPEIHTEIFSAVFSGVKRGCVIQFFYRSLEQPDAIKRECEPYHIVCQRGVWYVIGRCLLRKELRIFSFSRMHKVKVIENKLFTIPKDFKAEDYIDKNVGVWLKKKKPFTVKLLFSPSVGVFAEEHIWSREQKIKVLKDKSVEVSFSTTQTEEIKRFVLGQGATVRVLEPAELVEEVRTEINKMIDMYQLRTRCNEK